MHFPSAPDCDDDDDDDATTVSHCLSQRPIQLKSTTKSDLKNQEGVKI